MYYVIIFVHCKCISCCHTEYGQNGNGATDDLYEPPSERIDFGVQFEANFIDCGSRHCCAVSTRKEAKCWGQNDNGRLGQGDEENRGDAEGEMGDNLTIIDLGSEFLVDSISAGSEHTCALSTNHTIKCFGKGGFGPLGYESHDHVGDESGEMGDALPLVDLGMDFEPIQVTCQYQFTCALSTGHRVKCWGRGIGGILGSGVDENIGANAGTMGDNMAAINLGTDFDAIEISGAVWTICALSTNHEIKCWGQNHKGQLGVGDTENRGNAIDEMGDNLIAVDLGTNFIPYTISVGNYHVVAVSVSGEVKAWGFNDGGQLGYGDKENRGDEPNEMGDDLTIIDLGSGLTVYSISDGGGKYSHHCVWLRNVSQFYGLKCFGYGANGRLGNGDKNNRGDQEGEMGDSLPIIISYSGQFILHKCNEI